MSYCLDVATETDAMLLLSKAVNADLLLSSLGSEIGKSGGEGKNDLLIF